MIVGFQMILEEMLAQLYRIIKLEVEEYSLQEGNTSNMYLHKTNSILLIFVGFQMILEEMLAQLYRIIKLEVEEYYSMQEGNFSYMYLLKINPN